MSNTLRHFKRSIGFAALAASSVIASAQTGYPNKPIRVISPWPSGGPAEALGRQVTAKMTEVLGQPFVIESRPGANGTIGTQFVAKSPPDGYTLLLANLGPTAIAPALSAKDAGYDPLKDFEAISLVVYGPTLLVVRKDLPINNVKELVEYAKQFPGKLSYASVGPASTTHLVSEMLNLAAGISTVHIPYKGSTPALTDVIGGRVDFAFFGISGVIQQARAGQVRAIAISTLKRSPNFPDIPTVHETVPNVELNSWYGMMAPAGTPRPIVARLQQEIAAAVRKPDVIEWMKTVGLDPVGSTSEEFSAYLKSELAKWSKTVKDAKITTN